MALQTVNITIGQSLGGGLYSSTVIGGGVSDTTTILADITTALGLAGGAHDSTPELTTIQTDAVALTGSLTGDLSITWNDATITTRNALRAGLLKALEAVNGGYGGLSE